MRKIIIANYIRQIYVLDPLSGKNEFNHIEVDESLFVHNNGVQQWIVGLINSETKEIRLELVEKRTQETLKKIISKHVCIGNYMITDAWQGYNFLDVDNSGYEHHIYNHARGNFGSGLDSTSQIEGVWGQLKLMLKKIYSSIRPQNFIYFIREIEFRRMFKNSNANEKLNWLTIAFECVGNEKDPEFLSEEELISLDYDTVFDD